MSDATREARRLTQSPYENERERARLWAQIAQAEALERIADHLDRLTDDERGTALRTTAVPR